MHRRSPVRARMRRRFGLVDRNRSAAATLVRERFAAPLRAPPPADSLRLASSFARSESSPRRVAFDVGAASDGLFSRAARRSFSILASARFEKVRRKCSAAGLGSASPSLRPFTRRRTHFASALRFRRGPPARILENTSTRLRCRVASLDHASTYGYLIRPTEMKR